MNTSLFAVSAALLALTGCASSDAPSTRHPAYVKPGLIMLTADQAEHRGLLAHPVPPPPNSELLSLDASAVVADPGIKVYTVGRIADAQDRDLLHEEHVVYRRESTPQWRLQAPAGQKLLTGPRQSDGRQELQPLLDKELTTFLLDQRRSAEANQKAIAALFQAVDALSRQQQAIAARDLEHGDPRAPAESARDAKAGETAGAAPAPPSSQR